MSELIELTSNVTEPQALLLSVFALAVAIVVAAIVTRGGDDE